MTQKRKKNWDVLNLIRYGILTVLVIYIIILIVSKGASNASFESVSESVEKAADISTMTKGSARDLKRYYGLNQKDYDDVLFYYTNQTMGVEEILIVKLISEEDALTVEDAVKGRLEEQLANFEGYGARQVQLLKSAGQKTKGNYVFFAVSPNVEKLEKAFVKSL